MIDFLTKAEHRPAQAGPGGAAEPLKYRLYEFRQLPKQINLQLSHTPMWNELTFAKATGSRSVEYSWYNIQKPIVIHRGRARVALSLNSATKYLVLVKTCKRMMLAFYKLIIYNRETKQMHKAIYRVKNFLDLFPPHLLSPIISNVFQKVKVIA